MPCTQGKASVFVNFSPVADTDHQDDHPYIKGGMAPLAKGGRIPLWKGFDPDLVLNSLCEEKGVINEESVRTYMSIGRDQGLKSYTTSNDSKIKAIRKEEMEAAFYGKKTVDQACEDAKTRADELLKK